jgi:hypothetical protein
MNRAKTIPTIILIPKLDKNITQKTFKKPKLSNHNISI